MGTHQKRADPDKEGTDGGEAMRAQRPLRENGVRLNMKDIRPNWISSYRKQEEQVADGCWLKLVSRTAASLRSVWSTQ